MIDEQDRAQVHEHIREIWPNNSRNLPHYVQQAVTTANRLDAPLEVLLDAITEHSLDDTARADGYRVGYWPPQPADLNAQVTAVRRRVQAELNAEDVRRQLDEQKVVAKTPLNIPNMPQGVAEWTRLVCKKAAHLKGAGPALTALQTERYDKLKAYFKPEPPHPTVQTYWAHETETRRAHQQAARAAAADLLGRAAQEKAA